VLWEYVICFIFLRGVMRVCHLFYIFTRCHESMSFVLYFLCGVMRACHLFYIFTQCYESMSFVLYIYAVLWEYVICFIFFMRCYESMSFVLYFSDSASSYNSGKWPTWRTVSSIICSFESSTCFEQLCAHPQEDKCINTTSGIITVY